LLAKNLLTPLSGFVLIVGISAVNAPLLQAEDALDNALTVQPGIQKDLMSLQSLMPRASGLGRVTPRVVGGDVASFGEQRWITSLQFRGQHVCGAALIGPSWVMTAAHCVAGMSLSTAPLTAWVGGHDLRVDSQSEISDVDRIIIHPNYNPNNMEHDIALLKLADPITTITPVRLATAEVMATAATPGQPVKVSGWGALSEGGGAPSTLHDVTVPVVPNRICNAPQSYSGLVASTMLCAGLSGGGQDSCHGDSGGPLWLNLNGIDVHVGIVSWGTGCARPNKYGVYTRSAAYLNWISAVTNLTLNNPAPSGSSPDTPDNCATTPSDTATPAELLENYDYTFGRLSRGQTLYFEVRLPTGVSEMIIETRGGQGDLDLYVSRDRRPTTSSYAYASRNLASAERIRVNYPAAGTWYVMAHAYSGTSGVAFNLKMYQ